MKKLSLVLFFIFTIPLFGFSYLETALINPVIAQTVLCSVPPDAPQWIGDGISRVRTDLVNSYDQVTFIWNKDLLASYYTMEFSYDDTNWIPLLSPASGQLAQIPPDPDIFNEFSFHIAPNVPIYIKIYAWNSCGESGVLTGEADPLPIPIVTVTPSDTPVSTVTPTSTPVPTPTDTPVPTPTAIPENTPIPNPTPTSFFTPLSLPPINWTRPVMPTLFINPLANNQNPSPTIVVPTPGSDIFDLRFSRPLHR